MGVFYILLSVLCSLCIAHLLKIVQKKQLPIIPVLVINYITAAILSLSLSNGDFILTELSCINYIFAISIGFLFITNFFLYSYSIEKSGIGVSIAAMRLSLVLPIIVSVFAYNEYIELSNYFGIVSLK